MPFPRLPLALGLLAAAALQPAFAADALKPFPLASEGMQRHVIRLAPVEHPEDWRVEIIAGREIEADCNRLRFRARLSEKVIEGWGYAHYTVSALQGPMGTLMACPPESAKSRRFVAASFEQEPLLRYNAKLPLVIYAPADVQIRYRLWQAAASLDAPRE